MARLDAISIEDLCQRARARRRRCRRREQRRFHDLGGAIMADRASPAAAASTIPSPKPSATRRWCGMHRMPKEAGVKADILLKLEFFNPLVLGQGPHRRRDDRGAGEAGHHHARQDHAGRADQRQHRHRAGLRRRRQGLQADPGDAGIHVDGTAQDAADPGRGARTDRSRQGHEGRHRPRPGTGRGDIPAR